MNLLFAQHRIKPDRGLIENEQLGVVYHGTGERQAALLSSTALLDHLTCRRQLQQVLEQLELLPNTLICQSIDATEVKEGLLDGHLLDQRDLLWHKAHTRSGHTAARLTGLNAQNTDVSAVEITLPDNA